MKGLRSIESLRLRDGRQLCVRRWRGQGQGILVALHGLLDSSEGWNALSARMSCSILAFDLPGFGYSDAPPSGSIAGYAQDVAEGLEMLGVERFTLVGHSLGGGVATAVAELMPGKVAGLVLLAPVGFGQNHLAEVASFPILRTLAMTALPWALSSRIAVTAAYLTMVTNGKLPERETVDRVTRNGRALVAGTQKAIRAIVDESRCNRERGLRRRAYRGPVTAIWGDRDRLVPASHRNALLAVLPQARIQLWEGVGHHPMAEQFDELVRVLKDSTAPLGARTRSRRQSTAGSVPRLADAA